MARRVWRPAVDGTASTGPILEGMHFHDTRHTHKTWLIDDDIPEIAQARRLGHRLPRHLRRLQPHRGGDRHANSALW